MSLLEANNILIAIWYVSYWTKVFEDFTSKFPMCKKKTTLEAMNAFETNYEKGIRVLCLNAEVEIEESNDGQIVLVCRFYRPC